MKNTTCPAILLIILLAACNCSGHKSQLTSVTDSLPGKARESVRYPRMKMYTAEQWEQMVKEGDESRRKDSNRLVKVLNVALNYAYRNKNKKSFYHEFEMLPDDSSFNVPVQMLYGNLICPDRKHLLVRNGATGAVGNLYIFLLNNDKFKKVCEGEQLGISYLDDTLKDINGDGFKDFLIHYYPSSGCCLRDVYSTYLYKPQTGSFTSVYEFINPTFYPAQKIIRGVGYGHPGEVGLYKYKWNGFKVDTIEFIYSYAKHEGKFIKTKKREYMPTEKDGIVLNSLPGEYRHVESIEWFLLDEVSKQ